MKSYKLIPHTADVRLKVECSTLQELFIAALQGMAEIIKPDICKQNCTEQEHIKIQSNNETMLLIDFLSEVLTQTQISKIIYCQVEFAKLTKSELQATIIGIKTNDFEEDIKAVTYHEAEIIKNQQGNFETIIIFDI